jgi:hypothetical protein
VQKDTAKVLSLHAAREAMLVLTIVKAEEQHQASDGQNEMRLRTSGRLDLPEYSTPSCLYLCVRLFRGHSGKHDAHCHLEGCQCLQTAFHNRSTQRSNCHWVVVAIMNVRKQQEWPQTSNSTCWTG